MMMSLLTCPIFFLLGVLPLLFPSMHHALTVYLYWVFVHSSLYFFVLLFYRHQTIFFLWWSNAFSFLQMMECQMEDWYKEVGELQAQATSIPHQGEIMEKVSEKQVGVETRIVRLIEPLKERRRILLASKEVHQVGRDLEDEIVSFLKFEKLFCKMCHNHTIKMFLL